MFSFLFASQVRGEAVCDLCCVAVVSASGSLNFLFGGDLLEFCGVWDVFLGVVGVVLCCEWQLLVVRTMS